MANPNPAVSSPNLGPRNAEAGRGEKMFATMRRGLGAAKINVLEKMGKRETTETAEMQNEYRVRMFESSVLSFEIGF